MPVILYVYLTGEILKSKSPEVPIPGFYYGLQKYILFLYDNLFYSLLAIGQYFYEVHAGLQLR